MWISMKKYYWSMKRQNEMVPSIKKATNEGETSMK